MERCTMKSDESREKRKRKLELRGSELSTSSFHNQLKTPRLLTAHDRPPEENSMGNSKNTCDSTCSSDRVFASCGSSDFTSKFVDLEEEEDEVFSTASTGHSVDFSDWKSNTTTNSSEEIVKKMPSDAELEEFFAAAEKDVQKKFIEKYNYDIEKDEPLEGRYEWVQIPKSTE